jgi:hypothetical protein
MIADRNQLELLALMPPVAPPTAGPARGAGVTRRQPRQRVSVPAPVEQLTFFPPTQTARAARVGRLGEAK